MPYANTFQIFPRDWIFLNIQSAISAIRLQYPQSDCNLSNQTAISAIQLQSPQSMIKFYLDLPLGVHIPECLKRLAQCFKLQSPQSNCNLSNPTAISAIQLQSQQSMIEFYLDLPLGVHIPECGKHPVHCLRLQTPQSDCNFNNQTAISRNDSRNA